MTIFLLSILPCVACYEMYLQFKNKEETSLPKWSFLLYGLLFSIIYSFFRIWLASPTVSTEISIVKNTFLPMFIDFLLPSLIALLILIFFSKKITINTILLYLFFLGFYIIYLPVTVIGLSENLSFYQLLFKPILYVVFLLSIKYELDLLHLVRNIKKDKKVLYYIAWSTVAICSLFFFFLTDCLFNTGRPLWLVTLIYLCVCLYHVCLYFLMKYLEKKES
jgi:hypothetical protein